MKTTLQKDFTQLQMQKVPNGLFEKILHQIEMKKRKHALLSFIFSSMVFVATFVTMVPVFLVLHSAMSQSGSYQYFSLVFSNFGEVMSSWQDFALSFLESLPVFTIAIFLAIVFFLLASVHYISRDVKVLFFRHHF